ncbi:structural maintenance of chromosomes protein 2-like [Oscarella lobularis]|uniref:structural maintenance of chromosomes protein 2-like n=1 Tax=Oscarella lobularis TaxID=121494 RepID=UPI0033139B1C
MQRLKRSFTFGGRGRRRNAGGGDDDKEKKRKSSLSHDAENGTENPDALPPKTDAEALKDAKSEIESLRRRFEDAEERFRNANTSKRGLVKGNEELEKKAANAEERYAEAAKELESLREDVTRLQTEVSELDCDKEDLQEKFQRKSHALERELHDTREAFHEFRNQKEKIEKELKEIKTRALVCSFDEKVGKIKLHAVHKNVSAEFVNKSLNLATENLQDIVETFVSEWADDREVAKPKDVIVYFLGLESEPDVKSLTEDFQRVISLGKLALLVPLSSTDTPPFTIPSDSISSFHPISLASIRADLVGGSLSETDAGKIADACKVAHLNASLSHLVLS